MHTFPNGLWLCILTTKTPIKKRNALFFRETILQKEQRLQQLVTTVPNPSLTASSIGNPSPNNYALLRNK